jgi:hypothetical protein
LQDVLAPFAFLPFPTPLLALSVVGVTDDECAALDLLCDAVEASLPFPLHVAAPNGIVGQLCDCTATAIGSRDGDECATVARQSGAQRCGFERFASG